MRLSAISDFLVCFLVSSCFVIYFWPPAKWRGI